MDKAIQDIIAERERQKSLSFGGKPATDFDQKNGQADWVNYIVRYAAGGAPKLENRKDFDFRAAMVKTAALAVAAIEAFDAGFAQE